MGAESTMAARDRRKRKKNVVWRTFVRLFFVLLLLSMLAAYISNQVTISSKRAELDTLNEQIRSPSGSRGILTTTPHPMSASLWM